MNIILNNQTYYVRFVYAEDRRWADCLIKNGQTEEITAGTARVQSNPHMDKQGVRIKAFAKTLSKFTTDRNVRRQFWKEFVKHANVPPLMKRGIELQK